MQAEWLEKWIEENEVEFMLTNANAIRAVASDDLRALLSRFVLCDAEPIYFSHRQAYPLYAHADIGTMRIVAIQGAAEEYARQGNTVLDNKLWYKFGKEGGE
jgi:hypothetical protein